MVNPNWHTLTLGEVVTLKRGYDLSTSDRLPGNIPVVSSSGITGFHNEAKVKGPGVVTGRYGTLGEIFYVMGDYWPLNTTLYVQDFKGNHPRFIYYLLGTLGFANRNDKSSVPGLNRNDLHQINLTIPPPPQQCAIADILLALDDKIDLNRRVNETLEAVARAVFKSWFVDFDPVRAKAEGRRPARMDAETATLFPNTFEESAIGQIPKGWDMSRIGDLCEFAYGAALKAESRQSGRVPVYGSNGQVGWHNEALVKGPGIIIGRKGNPGTVVWSETDFFAIDTTFYVVPNNAIRSMHYLFHALSLQDLPALGADSAVPGLNRNMAYMSDLLIPSSEVMSAFDTQASPLSAKIRANEDECQTLAAIRDGLLPKLMSGEVRAEDANNTGPL